MPHIRIAAKYLKYKKISLLSAFLLFSLMTTISTAQAQAAPAVTEWHTKEVGEKTLSFSTTQMGAEFTGVFQAFTPVVFFDPNRLQDSYVKVTVPLTSAFTDDEERDEALQNDDWFDTEAHPIAVFETTSIALNEGKNAQDYPYIANAKLTIRGIEKQITLPFSFVITENTARATGATTLNRIDFEVGAENWDDPESVGLFVDVAFTLDLFIHKQ